MQRNAKKRGRNNPNRVRKARNRNRPSSEASDLTRQRRLAEVAGDAAALEQVQRREAAQQAKDGHTRYAGFLHQSGHGAMESGSTSAGADNADATARVKLEEAATMARGSTSADAGIADATKRVKLEEAAMLSKVKKEETDELDLPCDPSRE